VVVRLGRRALITKLTQVTKYSVYPISAWGLNDEHNAMSQSGPIGSDHQTSAGVTNRSLLCQVQTSLDWPERRRARSGHLPKYIRSRLGSGGCRSGSSELPDAARPARGPACTASNPRRVMALVDRWRVRWVCPLDPNNRKSAALSDTSGSCHWQKSGKRLGRRS
jgi:hypothetical protein